jgi:hypothetical protein
MTRAPVESERACVACHTPEAETPLEYRGHGGGWLLCVGGCKPRHGCHQREYGELTPGVLDALEDAADRAQRDFEPTANVAEVDAAVLHSLIRLAKHGLADVIATLRLDAERMTAPTTPRDYARGKAYEIEKGYHVGAAAELAAWRASKDVSAAGAEEEK